MAVLELVYNPVSSLPYQDRMYVPVAGPSIFSALQQVQQLAAQRAEADAIGRQSLANALRYRQALQAQNLMQQQQASLLNALAAAQAAEQQRQAAAEQQYRNQLMDYQAKKDLLSALDKREQEIKREAQSAEKQAAELALSALEEEEQDIKQAAATRLSALQSIVNQKNPLPYLDTIPQLFMEIAQTTEDRTPLRSYATHLKAQLDELGRLYQVAHRATQDANTILIEEIQRQLEPTVIRKAAEQMYNRLSPLQSQATRKQRREAAENFTAQVQKAIADRNLPELHSLLESAGLGYALTAATQEALRRVKTSLDEQSRKSVTLGPTGFVPVIPQPPDPKIIDEWLERAERVTPIVKKKPVAEKYKVAREIASEASSEFLQQLDALKQLRNQILRAKPNQQSESARPAHQTLRVLPSLQK